MRSQLGISLVASTDAIAAPYPKDTKAKGWRFELDYERIEQSDTWALATPDMRPWLLMLWLTAWRQVPCGSLPAADELIAARIGMEVRQLRAHRDILLRGWWLADDGRLYHPVITEQVLGLIGTRSTAADRKRGFDQKVHRIKLRDGCSCVYCGATERLTVDHLFPFSRRKELVGALDVHGEDNLVTSCQSCNSSKGDKTPDEAGMAFVSERASAQWQSLRDNNLGEIERRSNALPRVRNAARTLPEPEPEPVVMPLTTGSLRSPVVVPEADAPVTTKAPPKADPEKPWIAVAERCPHQKLVRLYHELLPTLNAVSTWDDRRQAYSRSRWREEAIEHKWATEDDGLKHFAKFFRYVGAKCPHLMGKSPPKTPDAPPFQADLEWLLRPTNYRKVVEGRYEK